MSESTFPLLLAIILFGAVAIDILGRCNPYVPKMHRQRIKSASQMLHRGEVLEIPIRRRYKSVTYLVVAIIFMAVTLIAYFALDFPVLVNNVNGEGPWKIAASVVAIIFVAIIITIVYYSIALGAEMKATEAIAKYYKRRYNWLDIRFYDS